MKAVNLMSMEGKGKLKKDRLRKNKQKGYTESAAEEK